MGKEGVFIIKKSLSVIKCIVTKKFSESKMS